MELKSSNPKALETLNSRLKELSSKVGKVGWFESAKYPDGTPVAEVAAQNEFGDPDQNIPARPTVRPAAIENKTKWTNLGAWQAKQILEGKSTAQTAMELLTADAQGAIAKNISTLKYPELSPVTIADRQRRGNSSTKPLIDTTLEFSTLTSVVEDANT